MAPFGALDTAPGRALAAPAIGAPPEGPGRRPEARTFQKWCRQPYV
jgi:hypothetical protein